MSDRRHVVLPFDVRQEAEEVTARDRRVDRAGRAVFHEAIEHIGIASTGGRLSP